jgi:glycosidase
MLALTRRLLALRRESDALTFGSYAYVEPVPDDVYAYLREGGDGRYLIALSFSDGPRTLALPNLGRGEVVASTRMDRDGEVDSGTVDLRAHEGVVLRLR